MKLSVIGFTMSALVLTLSCLIAGEAQAVPSFSRQYKTECTTCHTVIYERNKFGEAFEKNSYVWPTEELPQAARQAAAAPGPGEMDLNEALLNSGIPIQIPLSFLAHHQMVYDTGADPELDLMEETELEFFLAGNFNRQVGFWLEYKLAPGDPDLGEAYLQFRHVFNTPVNVRVGNIKPDLSLWKSNDRPSISKFGYHGYTVGDNPFKIGSEIGGVEINAVVTPRLYVAAGVTNDEADDDITKDQSGKDYYGHVSVRVGGTDFLGNEPEVSLDEDSVWDYLTLTFGGFYYGGSSNDDTNDFFRAGLESEILYQRLKVRLGGYLGEDDSDGLETVDSEFYMAQAQYLIGSKVLPAARFEYLDIENEGVTRRYIPSVSYAYLENLRLALEYMYDDGPEETDRSTTLRVTYLF